MATIQPSNNEDSIKLSSEAVKKQKLIQNTPYFKDNLFVPLGCFTTISALAIGLWNFRKGQSRLSQHMMKIRIIAQGLTITALIGSVLTTEKVLK